MNSNMTVSTLTVPAVTELKPLPSRHSAHPTCAQSPQQLHSSRYYRHITNTLPRAVVSTTTRRQRWRLPNTKTVDSSYQLVTTSYVTQLLRKYVLLSKKVSPSFITDASFAPSAIGKHSASVVDALLRPSYPGYDLISYKN